MLCAMSRRLPTARAVASRSAMLGAFARAIELAAAQASTAIRATLIRFRKIGPNLCGFPAGHAKNVAFLERLEDARRRGRGAFDLSFTLRALAPGNIDHAGPRAAELQKLVSIRRGNRVIQQKRLRLRVEGGLNFVEQIT